MFFAPIDKMWERVENERQDSDKALFDALLNLGELVVKIVVAGMVAAVDDRNRDQYRQIYRLVRANGLGEWSQALLDDVLTGPAAQHVIANAQGDMCELTQRCGEGTWQYAAVTDMHRVLKLLKPSCEALQSKVAAKLWIDLFVQVRNKSRGHGALLAGTVSEACTPLEASIRQFIDHFALFMRSWAYLHRSLSGKYRVTKISADTSTFDWLKTKQAIEEKVTLPDGIYVCFGSAKPVELMSSDVDGLDFFFPNGGATGKRYELLSYITGTVREADIAPFVGPPTELPVSETQGFKALKDEGRSFGNLPPVQQGYITRERLETDLKSILCDDRHPVVTLVGRGGIGKTSLALKVLSEIAKEDRFGLVLWFSARDIDLLPQGPKRVRPDVLTVDDVAQELAQLLEPLGLPSVKSETGFLAKALTSSPFDGMPILFVFDNFETVRAPQDLYGWIDQHVRLPNKVLITTRTRDFKGDYPVEVSGMNEDECDQLIDAAALLFNITAPLSEDYRQQLYRESDGHPYVIKVLLGEVKKTGHALKVERIVASQDEILNALFERTYNGLSPVAQRLFLTLSSWRSVVPQLAVEAVLLRPQNERMDVERAIEELRQSSLIDVSDSDDGSTFLMVPLVASLFGKRKLKVSPWRSAIEADVSLLQNIGVAQLQEVHHGIGPRVEQMFRNLAQRAAQNPAALVDDLPIMQFVARKYSPAWLLLSEVLEEHAALDLALDAKTAVMSYLEVVDSPTDRQRGWERLAELGRRGSDIDGEAHALMELCLVPDISFDDLSNAVNRFNSLGTFGYRLDTEEKQLLARRVAQAMERRIHEGGATDCSRLAWLYHHIRDVERARQFVELGLKLDFENEYCDRLARRLGMR